MNHISQCISRKIRQNRVERSGLAAAWRARRHNYYCPFWQNAPARERQIRCPLKPVLGRLKMVSNLSLAEDTD